MTATRPKMSIWLPSVKRPTAPGKDGGWWRFTGLLGSALLDNTIEAGNEMVVDGGIKPLPLSL